MTNLNKPKGHTLLAALVLSSFFIFNISCSEFGNSSKSSNDGAGKAGGPGTTPDKNPFASDSPYQKPNDGSFTVEKMLVNIGTNLVYPASRELLLQSSILVRDVDRACQTPATAKIDSPEWKKAQSSWKEAMLSFHYIEAMSVGPLRKDNFESHLYSWPYVSLCGIDQMVVGSAAGTKADLKTSPINVKGLGALEFLLFDKDMNANCNVRAYPAVAEWAKKSAAEKSQDRCVVAKDLARDLETNAKFLENSWNPEAGNFSKTLVDGSVYADSKAALTDLLHGLYSIEELKDLRLARPLGLSKECTNEDGKCPELAEHALSGLALEAMAAQVRGFHDAFYGSSDESVKAFSFDDYLENVRYPDVSTRMGGVLYDLSQNLETVKAAGGFQDQINAMNVADCKATTMDNRKVELCGVYLDAREITTILKTQILSIFSLQAPPGYQGDND